LGDLALLTGPRQRPLFTTLCGDALADHAANQEPMLSEGSIPTC
jgi:hypothetical protein